MFFNKIITKERGRKKFFSVLEMVTKLEGYPTRRFGTPDWQKQDMVTKLEWEKENEWKWGLNFEDIYTKNEAVP